MDPAMRYYYAIHGLPSPDTISAIVPQIQLDIEPTTSDYFLGACFSLATSPCLDESIVDGSHEPRPVYRYIRHRRSNAISVTAPPNKSLPPLPVERLGRRRAIRFARLGSTVVAESLQPLAIHPDVPARIATAAVRFIDETTLLPLSSAAEADALPVELTSPLPNPMFTNHASRASRCSSASSSTFSADSVSTDLLFDDSWEMIDPSTETDTSDATVSQPSTPRIVDPRGCACAMHLSNHHDESSKQHRAEMDSFRIGPEEDKDDFLLAWLERACR
ncbi:hypothetical protein FH972_021880 [Carpinus fangiana]|uniref:Uncharacterized protein n=1 Tax=Carpinus fangiana TaxID=176857 RepID=A0A5N6KQZ4_9ROSI|nr:hypothetical protein FH972_021880 [Carpinus fangiana]